MNNIKVELKTDLTKYGEGLITGIKGITIGQQGIWSRSFEYTRIDGCYWSKSIGIKNEADKLLDVFSEYKLNVKIQKII